MTITQTVEIPPSRRLTIDVPREVPVGRNIIAFTPAAAVKERMSAERENELFRLHADELNAEAEDVLEFQDIDAIYDDLEQLTPQMFEVMRDTMVPLNLADIVSGSHSDLF